ncbi:MAG: hypothetical protein M3457_20005 [Chloroflexota bacterium]|nr:hypothetical protein [Chloroflexota bacterium]
MTSADGPVPDPSVDILFILAHPDDESFGFAGLIAQTRTRDASPGLGANL